MVAAIKWDDALAWRMRRQFLSDAGALSVEDVVKRLVAVPSWSGDAELAIGLRMQRAASGAVAEAFARDRLIKTFAFRGSMNYFVPEDAGVYLALRASGRQWELKSWREFYRLEVDDWPALRSVVRDAVSSSPLTQRELAAVVTSDRRFAHLGEALTDKSFTILKPLAWQGDISLGPTRDGAPTLQAPAVASTWSGPSDLEEAGPVAVRAYLAAYGPASAGHLQYWLGEGLSVGRRRVAGWIDRMRGHEIISINVEGDSMLCCAEHVEELSSERASGVVRLLPGLDPWILGAGTADVRIVPPGRRTQITRGANPVLVDGRVTGIWKITKQVLQVTAFTRTFSRTDLDAERGRLSEALGHEIGISVD